MRELYTHTHTHTHDGSSSMNIQELLVKAQLLSQQGNLADAEKIYSQILDIRPDLSQVRILLAIIWNQTGRIQEAVTEARQAMAEWKNPTASIYNNYGILLKSAGFLNEAKKAWRKALEVNPKQNNAKANLLKLYLATNELDNAIHILEEMGQENLEDPVPWINIGRIAINKLDFDLAEKALYNAEKRNPRQKHVILLKALFHHAKGDEMQAVTDAMNVLDQDLLSQESWKILDDLLPDCLLTTDHLTTILQRLVSAHVQDSVLLALIIDICRKNLIWDSLPELENDLAKLFENPHQNTLFTRGDSWSLLMCHIPQRAHRYAAESVWRHHYFHAPLPQRKTPPLSEIAPLRVAFLSSDFRQHAMGFSIAGLLEKLPKGNITWFAYNNSLTDNSSIRKRIYSGFDHFINVVKLGDQELAERIRDDRIDILIDMNGVTAETRVSVLSWKAAPIQMTWLGMPGSTGGEIIDYVIGDEIVSPITLADGFSEKILQLPRSYFPNDDQRPDLSLAGTRADHNLPEKAFVFSCFNQHQKFSPETFQLWKEIFQVLPDAVLWIQDAEWEGVRDRLIKQAQKIGIDSDRLILGKKLPQAEHISRLSLADLVLDTLPYNAHTTCSDSLRAGIPIVTLLGQTFAGRVAASILTSAHLSEWIAYTPEEYIHKAISFASLPRTEIEAIKKHVSTTYWHSPMVDNLAFANLFEKMCLNLYKRHSAGLPKKPLKVTREGDLIELG